MEIVLKIIGLIAFLAFAFWYSFIAPDWLRSLGEYLFEKLYSFLLSVINISFEAVNISVHILHWVGRVLVMMIFFGAAIILIDNIAVVLEIEFLNHENVVFKLTRLFENKITWVASTAIVATTVALGHFRTIDFNYEKHRQEKLEKYRERREKTKNT
jgi:hypothetical protein